MRQTLLFFILLLSLFYCIESKSDSILFPNLFEDAEYYRLQSMKPILKMKVGNLFAPRADSQSNTFLETSIAKGELQCKCKIFPVESLPLYENALTDTQDPRTHATLSELLKNTRQ